MQGSQKALDGETLCGGKTGKVNGTTATSLCTLQQHRSVVETPTTNKVHCRQLYSDITRSTQYSVRSNARLYKLSASFSFIHLLLHHEVSMVKKTKTINTTKAKKNTEKSQHMQ